MRNSMNEKNKTVPSANGGGNERTDRSRKTRNDLLLIGVLLAVLIVAGLALLLFGKKGDCAVVTVNGEEYGIYPLWEEATVDIRTGEQDENLNRLVIRDGKALIETATCPDGICAAHHPISREGESIICLPHRVIVTVEQEKQ